MARALDQTGMTKRRRNSPPKGVAAVLVLMVFAAGCGTSAHARRQARDREIGTLVQERLAAAPDLAGASLEASSYEGVVALLGQAPDEEAALRAERAAAAVPGVVRVNNLILVVKGASRAEGSAPAKGTLVVARAE